MTNPAPRHERPLKEGDPEVYDAIAGETRRQAETLELIASENFVSPAVLEAVDELARHGIEVIAPEQLTKRRTTSRATDV